MLGLNEILDALKTSPQGYLKPDDELFATSNSQLLQNYNKLGVISSKDGFFDGSSETNKIFCNEFRCSAVFDDISSYQSHYNVKHRFICAECKKFLPTNHLLDLHISERHDSYFNARIERGERLYKCYLEECQETFGCSYERKQHCIKQHQFPNNYRFDQVDHKKCFSKKKDISEITVEYELQQNNCKKSRELRTISFGHEKEKTFCLRNVRKQNQETGKTLENINTLKEALPSL